MRGLWEFLPWWFHSISWQIDSDSFQFSKFEFHCLHFPINKTLPCEIRSYWTLHTLWLKLGTEYHLCVIMDSCQQVFSYLLQRKILGRSERVASLPGTSCKKVMLFCFKFMFLVACKVGVIQSSRNLCTCSFPRVWEKEPKWLCGKGFWATAQNSFQQSPQDQSHFMCFGCKKTTLTPTKSSQMWCEEKIPTFIALYG